MVLGVTAAVATHHARPSLVEAAATSSLRVQHPVWRRARYTRRGVRRDRWPHPYALAILSSAITGFIDRRPREVGLS